MNVRKRAAILLLALSGTIGCDQATKHIAEVTIEPAAAGSFLGDVVRLQYVENQGGFWSLGASLHPTARFWLFTVATGMLLLGFAVRLTCQRREGLTETLATTFILGGGLSNLWDRLTRDGKVVDFLNLGVGGVRTGIFNLSDVAIMAGALMILWRALRSGALRCREGR